MANQTKTTDAEIIAWLLKSEAGHIEGMKVLAAKRIAELTERQPIIEERLNAILEWLAENAPHIGAEQKHLDTGSAERAYWHHGYATALQDIKKACK